MFTGLVQALGTVVRLERRGTGARLHVGFGGLGEDLVDGESVAVNGVCLTVAQTAPGKAGFDISTQSLQATTIGSLKPGSRVNLERALKASDRLGGHLVQGHVDGRGTVRSFTDRGGSASLIVALPGELAGQCVMKGSIAVDGVSLTIAGISGDEIEAALIPETLARTTLGSLDPGDPVNIETDVLGKYVYRYLATRDKDGARGISEDFLRESGFA
jgi:riboflavin synthase